MQFKNFFCGLCKSKRPIEVKTTIILIKDPDVRHGNICDMCYTSLTDIFNVREIQTKQLTLMREYGIKV